MKPSLRSTLLLSLAAGSASFAAKPPAVPPPPSFGETVEVNVVNVDVHVTDKSGNRVTDLQKKDFQLLEDGRPVEITNFARIGERRAETGAPVPAAGSAAPSATPAAAPSSPEDIWNLVVLFDDFNLNPASHARAVRQLRDFLSREITPADRVMLVTLDPGMRIRLPFTGDRAAVARAIDEIERLPVHGIEVERARRQAFQDTMTIQEADILDPNLPPCAVNIAGPAHGYAAARRQEVRRSIGALTLMVNSLSGVPGRKAVLHVSDGLPLIPGQEVFQLLFELCGGNATGGLGHSAMDGPEAQQPKVGGFGRDVDVLQVFDARAIGPQAYQAASQAFLDAQSYNVTKELQDLSAHANAQRVTLYTLQASGLQAPDASAAGFGPEERMFQFPAIGGVLRANDRDSLQLLADETGGRAILDANDFLPDLGRMRRDFESYYSLGYTPAHAGDGREHRIEVKVKRPGLQLRYRQSYRDKPMLEKTADRTLAALLYGLEENPLGIVIELGEQTPGPSGTVSVPIRLRIPLFKLAILNHEAAGLFEGSLRLLVATRGEDGRSSPVRQVAVPLKIPRKQVLTAMGQYYVYNLNLQLPPGEQRVAVAVRDEIAATTSYLSRAVTVETQAALKPSSE